MNALLTTLSFRPTSTRQHFAMSAIAPLHNSFLTACRPRVLRHLRKEYRVPDQRCHQL